MPVNTQNGTYTAIAPHPREVRPSRRSFPLKRSTNAEPNVKKATAQDATAPATPIASTTTEIHGHMYRTLTDGLMGRKLHPTALGQRRAI